MAEYRVLYKDDFGDIVAYAHTFIERANAERFAENSKKIWESIGKPKRIWIETRERTMHYESKRFNREADGK